MKRTPITRRAPLKSGKTLLRRCALNPVSAKRRQANGERRVVVNAMRLASDGRCARCNRSDVDVHGHERRGGSYRHRSVLSPDCLLCNDCNTWCEDNPQIAAWTGFKVSSKWPHDHTLTVSQGRDIHGRIVEFEIPEEGAA